MQDNSNFKAGIENFSFSNLANSRASFSMQGRNIWFWLSALGLLWVIELPVLLLLLTLLSRTIIRSKPYGETNEQKNYLNNEKYTFILYRKNYNKKIFIYFGLIFLSVCCRFFLILFRWYPKITKATCKQTPTTITNSSYMFENENKTN